MKNKLILAVVALFFAAGANAQNGLKVGYADVDYILSQLPQAKQVEADLQSHSNQLQTQIQSKYQEYQQKLAAYQQGAASMVDAVRREKEQELTDLGNRLQQFEQDAQASLQKKQNELMQPLFTQVGNAITSVSEEEGYDYVLSTGIGGVDIILFAKDGYDISDKVLTKLGVTPSGN